MTYVNRLLRVESYSPSIVDKETMTVEGCYEKNKDIECFRERNGHKLCTECPKNE